MNKWNNKNELVFGKAENIKGKDNQNNIYYKQFKDLVMVELEHTTEVDKAIINVIDKLPEISHRKYLQRWLTQEGKTDEFINRFNNEME